MKKHLLSWLWLGMLPTFNLWAAAGDVRLDPATTTVALNTAFGLKMLVDSGTVKLFTYNVKLTYDSAKLQVTTTPTTDGANPMTSVFMVNATVPGTLQVTGVSSVGVGPGVSLHPITFNFKCLGVAGSFPVALNVVTLTGQENTIGAATPRAGFGSTVTCGGTPKPDFVVTKIVVPATGTAAILAGGSFSAAITVKNQGTGSGTGGTLSVWNHSTTAPACSATGWSKQATVGTLAASASTTITVSSIPAGTAVGMRMLRAVVDSACVTAETVETNNQMILVYPVVKASGADVAITGVTLSPTASAINGTFSATVAIKNNSTTTPSVAGTLSVWNHRPDAAHCSASGASKTASVPILAANGTTSIVVSGIPAGATAGMKRLLAYVDSACTTAETNEVNNQKNVAYAVNAPAPAADFTVTTITLTPATPAAGATFSAAIIVKNASTTTAGDGRNLEVWNNNPGIAQYCGAVGDKRIAVGSVAANNGVVTKTVTGLVAGAGTTGTRSLRVYVDSTCGTNEVNEGNNQTTKTY